MGLIGVLKRETPFFGDVRCRVKKILGKIENKFGNEDDI